MQLMNAGIAERAVGQYPLSVATSLAIESANGIHPEIPVDSPPILKYEELWVNLKTLFRNFIGALDKVTAGSVVPEEIAANLDDEMEQISQIIAESSSGRCKVVFYVNNMTNLAIRYRYATLRKDNTPKQMEYTAILKKTLALMLADNKTRPLPILTFDRLLSPPQEATPKILLLTHVAYDLLSAKNFRSVTLLESHTGRLKDRALWYTKYANGRDLVMLPFREDLMQVFGDNETFVPMPIKVRKEVIEIANRFHWTSVTTTDKVRLGLEFIQDPLTREILKSIVTSQ
jgi:hypothetical protein